MKILHIKATEKQSRFDDYVITTPNGVIKTILPVIVDLQEFQEYEVYHDCMSIGNYYAKDITRKHIDQMEDYFFETMPLSMAKKCVQNLKKYYPSSTLFNLVTLTIVDKSQFVEYTSFRSKEIYSNAI